MKTTSRTPGPQADTLAGTANRSSDIEHDIDIQWGLAKCGEFPEDSTMVEWIGAALSRAGIDRATIAVRIMDRDEIATLNDRYRNKSGATNVLSFPASGNDDDGRLLLGDIAVCADVVLAEAGEQGKAPADHLAHMLVHGVLHLAGYDHEEDAEATEMEGIEREILASRGIRDPYRLSLDDSPSGTDKDNHQ